MVFEGAGAGAIEAREAGHRVGKDLRPRAEVGKVHRFVRIVAPVRVSDEDHRGGDPGPGEDRCVVADGRELADREAERCAALPEPAAKSRVEGGRIGADARAELERHPALAADALGEHACAALALDEERLRGAAEVEGEVASPRHLGHGVVGGVGEELPDREHGVRYPVRLALDPELFEGPHELDDGERGVVAPHARRRPGVTVPAGAAGVRKTRVAADRGRDPDRQAFPDEHRPLLDVELEEGPGVRGGHRWRRGGAKRLHVHPDLRHVLGERAAGVVAAQPVELLDRQRADREAAPHVGDPVPDALLAA